VPTVLRENGFDVMIFTHDHEPAHVHVFYGDELIIFDLLDLSSRIHPKMKTSNARRAKQLVATHRNFLMNKWKEIHGSSHV
jgi:hypothetical protein